MAILLLGGISAGCSSGVMRFGDSVDSVFTGSTDNQRRIINQQNQPYPGDVPNSAANREAIQPVKVSNGAVSRGSLPPVATASAPVAVTPAATPTLAAEPVVQKVAKAKPVLDEATTGTIAKPALAPAVAAAQPVIEDNIKGWSRAGGTQITAKEGETVHNLSRRFGVPADILMKVNGISAANGLKAGQKVVIPTYVYTAKAGVSAPDSDPKTAEAKSSKGVKEPVAPKPTDAPADNKTAVLPASPKLKESQPESVEAADSGKAKTDANQAKAAQKNEAKGSYTVVAGDSLSKISKKTGVPVAQLKQANGLKDGAIRIGQTLQLNGTAPVAAQAKATANLDTKPTASIPAPAEATKDVATYTPPKKADKAIEQAEKDSDAAAPNSTGIGKMRWPVRGKVVANYGKGGGGKNDGIDISVPNGTPVKAAENGVVIYAGDGLKDFGNTVLVRHENGLVTVYGHASELKVQRGQKVKRGEEIAVSGMSGNADAPKLHFEVRKNSAPVDPKGFLE